MLKNHFVVVFFKFRAVEEAHFGSKCGCGAKFYSSGLLECRGNEGSVQLWGAGLCVALLTSEGVFFMSILKELTISIINL